MYMSICSVYVPLRVGVWYPQRTEGDVGYPGTGFIDLCESPGERWKPSLSSLQEQQML